LVSILTGVFSSIAILEFETGVGKLCLGGVVMSDRVKLMLASLTVMMLPHRLGYSLTVLVLTAILSTAIDLAKATFAGMQVS
jgi:hypothetical protein